MAEKDISGALIPNLARLELARQEDVWWAEVEADRERSMRLVTAQADTKPISKTRMRRLMAVFLLRMPYLGLPHRVPKPRHGPHPLDTQYAAALKLRSKLYHDHVRNPMSAKKGGMKARTIGDREAIRNRVRWLAETLLPSIGKRRTRASLVGAILRRWRVEYRTPSESTVRRVLREMEIRTNPQLRKWL